MILTEQELRDLTDKRRPSAQKRVLDHIGVNHKERPDGSLIVLRAEVEAMHHREPVRRPQLRMA